MASDVTQPVERIRTADNQCITIKDLTAYCQRAMEAGLGDLPVWTIGEDGYVGPAYGAVLLKEHDEWRYMAVDSQPE
jgi:hypothetical protein